MGKSPEQLRLTPDERTDLVAYLDGELPEAHLRSISTKLTHSATARREVEILKKTWELLDHLPRPEVREQFTQKTLTEIHLIEHRTSAWAPRAILVGQWTMLGLVYLVLGVVSLGAGYAGVRWMIPDPSERLARDLALAEHLDEYLEVGSTEFLDDLVKSPDFDLSAP